MKDLIAQLKRIADALEASNDIQQATFARHTRWRSEDRAFDEQNYELNQGWIEWNKQQRVINQEAWDGMAQAATIQKHERGSTQPVGEITP